MNNYHIALVAETPLIDPSGLTRVSAALQRQVSQDLAPIWEVSATVDPFFAIEDVPAGYWPIIVSMASPGANMSGVHLEDHGQPTAWVEWSESWSLTASHECLEMLVDPWGNQLRTAHALQHDARVEYLVEVCDPCQDSQFAYTVNDTLVSDFYTPDFFDRVERKGVRYSLTGKIERPLQVLDGGYLTWHDPADHHFYQVHGPNGAPRDLGILKVGGASASLREIVDRNTPDHLAPTKMPRDAVAQRVKERRDGAKLAARQRAARLRQQLGLEPPQTLEAPQT